MIKKNRPKIYSKYEINIVLFAATMLLFVPLILVFTYVFDINEVVRISLFLIILAASNLFFLITGGLFIYLNRDKLKRKVKANYLYEFYYLVAISVFGVLGFVVLFDYLGGNRQYVANFLIGLVVVFFYALISVGRKFFRFDYRKKK